jgi:hypothetical protein
MAGEELPYSGDPPASWVSLEGWVMIVRWPVCEAAVKAQLLVDQLEPTHDAALSHVATSAGSDNSVCRLRAPGRCIEEIFAGCRDGSARDS